MQSSIQVMPLIKLFSDAFGVATICLVSLLVLLGLLCILYSLYFRSRIQRQNFAHLGYFNGPWYVRIALIFIAIWWGLGEVVRLSLLKGRGRILQALSWKWQENLCRFYILSNLGFAEPTMFLMLIFLLQASLQSRGLGTSRQWNRKIFGYVFLFCSPIFMAQMALLFIGSKTSNELRYARKMPKYFISTSVSSLEGGHIGTDIAFCTYPLLSTIALGFFSSFLVAYILYLGAKMLCSVINKGLRWRVYLLIASVISFLPLRVLFLGFSIVSHPGNLAFELLVFLAFLVLLMCAAVGICMLVYCPISDSLAVSSLRILERGELLDNRNSSSSHGSQRRNLLMRAAPGTVTTMVPIAGSKLKGGPISSPTVIENDALSSTSSLKILEELNLLYRDAHYVSISPDSALRTVAR